MDEPRTEPYIVLPVEKALAVWMYVAESGHMVSLKSVCSELSIPKTTAFRYLQTLVKTGLLEHDCGTELYMLGSRFHTIAKNDANIAKARQLARPFMTKLISEINCTVNLAVKGSNSIIYLDVLARSGGFQTKAQRGDVNPLHSTALGKAILAFLPQDQLQSYLCQPLSERTGRTLIEVRELESQLRRVAASGYATEAGENEDGAMCIGAPVLDANGYPLLAISVSVPLTEMSSSKGMEIGTRLLVTAREISGRLGFNAVVPFL